MCRIRCPFAFVSPHFGRVASQRLNHCRIGGVEDALVFQTSDEFCIDLLRRSSLWRIYPLVASIRCDVESLLLWTLTGVGAVFAAPVGPKERHSICLPAEYSLGDPTQVVGQPHLASRDQHRDVGGYHPNGQSDSEESACGWVGDADTGGLPADVLEDIADHVQAALAAHHPEVEAALGSDGTFPADHESAELDDGDDLAAAAAAVDESAAANDLGEGEASDPVVHATLGVGGYITCTVAPFNNGVIGRITTWPESKPMENRSSSCKCYMHPKCAVAKARWKVTDDMYIQWLFSVPPPSAGATADEKRALAEAHTKKGKEMLPK